MSDSQTSACRLSVQDSAYLHKLRGISILRVVLGHLGLFWIWPPYSHFLNALLPLLFFVSGAVAHQSLANSGSGWAYIVKRFVGLLVPYYFVCIVSLATYLIIHGQVPTLDLGKLLRWLTLSPPPKSTPFPLTQVWFVHALAVITLALPILLPRVRRSLRVVGLVVATILVLSIVQLSFRVDRLFYFAGHNLYQPMIGASYFIFGAAYAAHPVLRRAQASWMVLLLAGLSATVLVVAFDLDLDLSVHSYAPDIYYVSAGFAAIAAMLLLKPIILPICNKVPAVGWALDFLSRHSYAVFLAHTFFIWGAETWFGLVDVGGRPTAAVLKIGFVLVATMAIAPWFTRLSARTGETIRGRIV